MTKIVYRFGERMYGIGVNVGADRFPRSIYSRNCPL
jgi:hypothetical protein